MPEVIHTATVRATSGRDGRAISSDRALNVPLDSPNARQSADAKATNPEQLFAAAYGACFGSAIQSIARRDSCPVGDVAVDATVSLVRYRDLDYHLTVCLDAVIGGRWEENLLERIVRDADSICPYSRAIAGNVAVTIMVNGRVLNRTADICPARQ